MCFLKCYLWFCDEEGEMDEEKETFEIFRNIFINTRLENSYRFNVYVFFCGASSPCKVKK